MTLEEKIDTIDLIITALKEHEKRLSGLIDRLNMDIFAITERIIEYEAIPLFSLVKREECKQCGAKMNIKNIRKVENKMITYICPQCNKPSVFILDIPELIKRRGI